MLHPCPLNVYENAISRHRNEATRCIVRLKYMGAMCGWIPLYRVTTAPLALSAPSNLTLRDESLVTVSLTFCGWPGNPTRTSERYVRANDQRPLPILPPTAQMLA